MERDPPSLAWRAAPGAHVAIFLVLALAFVLAFVAVDLVRVVATAASADPGAVTPFLRLQIDLPRPLSGPLVLFPGFAWHGKSLAGTIGLVAFCLAAATALVAWILGRGESMIGRRAVGLIRGLLLDEIASARPTAREEARQAAALAGEPLARLGGALGGALTRPTLAGGAFGLAVLTALSADWRLALLVAALLAIFLKVASHAVEGRDRAAEARLLAGKKLNKTLADLVRRLPAVEAHGMARAETLRINGDAETFGRPVAAAERRQALLSAIAAFVLTALPAAILALSAAFGFRGGTPGTFAALAAAMLAAPAIVGLARQRRALVSARPLFDELGRILSGLKARNRLSFAGVSVPEGGLPGAGTLVAETVSAFEPASGVRIAGLELSLAFPAHVAVTGDSASGSRVFAALVAGRLRPSLGRLTFGGVDLFAVDPQARAQRIAFAGGEPVLIAGSLKKNLFYGCEERDAAAAEQRLAEATAVAGLDRLIHTRGLTGSIDAGKEDKLAAAVVDARRAIRTALTDEGLADSVEPFDPARYNRHATVAENILFGVPLGDTFRAENLPAHPFMQAILEAEELTRPLVAMGRAIAQSMIEIFADLPDGHPLYLRYAFFPGSERGAFEDLVERQAEQRRGNEPARDRERLISLALLYVETRHRLGLIDAVLEERIVKARAAFAELMPKSFRAAIEFYDPDRLCAAASLQDNLLFGRVTEERAGAEAAVLRLMRRVLSERGLDRDLVRVGLASPVDPVSDDFDPGERAAIDLVRCLVRRPDILVLERGLEHFSAEDAEAFVARLRRSLVGRGLLLVSSQLPGGPDAAPFDAVLHFERGSGQVRPPTASAPTPDAPEVTDAPKASEAAGTVP